MEDIYAAEPMTYATKPEAGRAVSGLLHRDPTLVVLAFAVWSMLSGVALLVPGNVFLSGPAYGTLLRLGIPEEVWGVVMLLDAVLLLWTTLHDGMVARSAVAAVSGGLWLYFGAEMVMGAAEVRLLSMVGCWEVVIGFALLAATVQWAGHSGGFHGH